MGELDLYKPDFEKENAFFTIEERKKENFDEETLGPLVDNGEEEFYMTKRKQTIVFKL